MAVGLLGLQLLGMPVALVARHQGATGAVLPRLELATAEAKGGSSRTTEEELIGEITLHDRNGPQEVLSCHQATRVA